MRLAFIILGLVFLGVGALEIALRLVFGFGSPPLYVADPQVGYRLAPNQRTRRFGNLLEINQYSMRGSAIAPKPDTGTLRVLMIGDSIANGGWWTDQSEILSVQIQQQLPTTKFDNYSAVEVLNASANSWGPRNELAYLAKFGTFDASVVVVLINTDDLFATAPTSVQVGRDRAYPSRRPPLALIEVLNRFKKPKPIPELQAVHNEGGDRVGVNLEAIRQIQHITQDANGQLILAMTPLLREVTPPGSRDYEITARQRLLQFTETQQILYIDFLKAFQTASSPESLYRDHIHLSREGNTLVSRTLSQAIQDVLLKSQSSGQALPDSVLDDPW
ncbi:MAG: SGNH/GDSL hydrolase family protein [Leptolyngbya sp. SIO1E4]|nr:SGNH/GDSL hydrolase family protein [Leptolyngbya sp. SIO1E4]